MKGKIMKRNIWVGIVGVALLFWSVSAQARPPHDGKGPKKNPLEMIERHADKLGIDDGTLEAIWEIADAGRTEGRQFRRSLRQLRKELREMLRSDEPDRVAVMAQVDAIGEIDVALRKHDLNILLDVRTLLTSEQKKALDELRRKRGKDGLRGKGNRGPRGGGMHR
jgi:Spy/CpxP family protein refolding chaperone